MDFETQLASRVDTSTSANYNEVVSTHIHLDWNINFDEKSINGKIIHNLTVKKTSPLEKVIFDCNKLNLASSATLRYLNNAVEVPVVVSTAPFKFESQFIEIAIPADIQANFTENFTFSIEINYSTTQESTALQWLSKENTQGKTYPYLFTQCQAIHARSLLPCQDTPQVKSTYTTTVHAPQWATVLMSALRKNEDVFVKSLENPEVLNIKADDDKEIDTPVKSGNDIVSSYFHQPVPIPSYLIALASGSIAGKALSERVKIWAEPAVLENAFFEFQDTEKFIQIAEDITNCPYVWTRYDVLCLPPSFPYGGMENPCITFATPTLLAGDRSLADVIAHEIAHSWSGNLVTNATWAHFWLNEGWTVWLERKISSRFHNDKEVEKLSAMIGFNHLKDDVELNNKNNAGEFCRLVWPQDGHDPDDAFSSVPYEKGYNFLKFLETTVGEDLYLDFVKVYFNSFKYQTVTSKEFLDFFLNFFKQHNTDAYAKFANVDWNDKFFNNDITENFDFSNRLYDAVNDLTKVLLTVLPEDKLYYNEDVEETENLSESFQAAIEKFSNLNDILSSWNSSQICLLLENLIQLNKTKLFSYEFFKFIEVALPKISKSNNSEIKFRFFVLTLTNDLYASTYAYEAALAFIRLQGRMKFIRPLTRSLAATEIGDDRILADFEEHKNLYHPIAQKMIKFDLQKWQELKDKE